LFFQAIIIVTIKTNIINPMVDNIGERITPNNAISDGVIRATKINDTNQIIIFLFIFNLFNN